MDKNLQSTGEGMAMVQKRTGKRIEATASTCDSEELMSTKKALEPSSKIEAAAQASDTNKEALSSAVSKREKVAVLAYAYWLQRGCRGGSPEEDWFRAEREINLASSI